jgi:hypothetical protein
MTAMMLFEGEEMLVMEIMKTSKEVNEFLSRE